MTQYLAVDLKRIRIERGGRTVLRDVDWKIRPGERWIVLGGNGAGKTQLLKLLAGDVWPAPTGSESRVYRWQGERWGSPFGIKEEIAYVGAERQDKYERYEWNHRVEQIVGTGVYRTDIPRDPLTARDRQYIARLLTKFGIEHLSARRFLTLSYGERRLTLLARALATRPKLLLLDELFNGLDKEHRARAMRWLEHTSRSGLPWVLATHHAEDISKTATHALILDAGRILYKGSIRRAPLKRWLSHVDPRAAVPPRRSAAKRRIQTDSDPIVRLSRATVYIDYVPIVRNASLELRAGDCWILHGPNGSGKTTLLRALYGDHALGDSIKRAGIEPGVSLDEFKHRVGWIAPHLQADHPLHLTVTEVVQTGRYASIGLNDPPTAADRAAARKAMMFFGLAKFAGRTLRELSYGQLRRVLFARAWITRPRLLLLDEPFAGIDAETRAVLLGRIEKLISQGVAVVMATHHRNEWPRNATHEWILDRGRTAYCGPMRS